MSETESCCCPICLDDIAMDETDVQFECLHRFHVDCWNDHVLKRPKELGYVFFCPVCRRDLGKQAALQSLSPEQKRAFELRVHDEGQEVEDEDLDLPSTFLFDLQQYIFSPDMDIIEEYAHSINMTPEAIRQLLVQTVTTPTLITRRA